MIDYIIYTFNFVILTECKLYVGIFEDAIGGKGAPRRTRALTRGLILHFLENYTIKLYALNFLDDGITFVSRFQYHVT